MTNSKEQREVEKQAKNRRPLGLSREVFRRPLMNQSVYRGDKELFGLDVELEMKARDSYTPAELLVVAEWIRVVCGEKVPV